MKKASPNFLWVEATLKNVRTKNQEKVKYVCRIALKFAVQKNIDSKNEKFNLAFKDRIMRVIYVDL